MLSDIKQPVQDWFADALENMGNALANDDDPSFLVELCGATIEVRLMSLPGYFERSTFKVPNASNEGPELATVPLD